MGRYCSPSNFNFKSISLPHHKRNVSIDMFVLNLLEHCRFPFNARLSQDNAELRGHFMPVSSRSDGGPCGI